MDPKRLRFFSILFASLTSACRLRRAKKRGNQINLSATLATNSQAQHIFQKETVHHFGQTWGCPAADIRILDNQFSNIRFQTENMLTKILNGYEVSQLLLSLVSSLLSPHRWVRLLCPEPMVCSPSRMPPC
jgi:hypothetical protein